MPTPIAQNGIPVAPGYPNYSNTFLIPPIQSDRMLERFYTESIFARITSRDALNEITGAFLGKGIAEDIFRMPSSFGGYQQIDTAAFFR